MLDRKEFETMIDHEVKKEYHKNQYFLEKPRGIKIFQWIVLPMRSFLNHNRDLFYFGAKFAMDLFDTYQEERQNRLECFELQTHIGKLIIGISNEWEDPGIYIGHSIEFITQAKRPVLKVINVFTGEFMIVSSKIIDYSDEMLALLCSLSPPERWALVANQGRIAYDRANTGPLKSFAEMNEAIEQSKKDFPQIWQQLNPQQENTNAAEYVTL